MRNFVFLFLSLLFTSTKTSAQSFLLNGYLKDSLTELPIADGTLSNNSKNKKVRTDARGFFSLPVSPGDLIYALAPNYRYDTLRYALLFQDTVTLFLSPNDVLQAVTVETGYQRYQMDSLQRRAAFEESKGATMRLFDQAPKKYFGLTVNLDKLFKGKDKNQGKQERFFTSQERQAYVNFRFSAQMVSFYTGLKGEALLNFLQRYTPSYEWLRHHPLREQIIDYLSEKLQAFRNNRS